MRCIIISILTFLALAMGTNLAQARSHIEFRGQRYYITKGPMEGNVGIGFDPLNDRVLSVAETDICGDNLVNRAGNNGVSWDPVNQEFWMINANRQVYRFDINNDPEVIFEIPQTFDVPGAGAQTLHSPQGLAVDMDHVYVVDFGPVIGETDSNQWFKFTRAGDPVSSSALTDFNANLQAHTDSFGDATVDGIMWVPPGAPMDAGLFYVAVEHTGIMVLDEDGFFVSNFLWTENDLVYGEHVPFAFAGLTMDPETGDLYLVENAGSLTHVWIRLEEGPQTILHGVQSRRVLSPDTRCARTTLITADDLLFSLAYRTVDGLLWTNSFNSGEVYTIDPLSGKLSSLGLMGIENVWGMAYDEERDVIYVYQEFPNGLHALDPNTLNTTLLSDDPGFVRELAFNSDDKHLYGVDGFSPAILVRYDRDTGVRTEVGETIHVAGITYDPLVGRLVGHNRDSVLYNIDPATGQAQVRANLPAGGGWEGLAAITITPTVSAVESPEPRVTLDSMFIRAYPNPVTSRADFFFELPRSANVRASVYDLAGRRVARLFEGSLSAGPQQLSWDGRDRQGRSVAHGMYFMEVRTPHLRASKKVSVTR